MSPSPHLELQIPRSLSGTRLDRALAQLIPTHSKAQLQKIVRRGGVRLDGKKVLRSNRSLRGGERLEVRFAEKTTAEGDEALEVLACDADILVLHKAAGMLVHPTERFSGGTVSELAVARFGPMPSVPEQNRPGIVHRLDRETSGVLVLARSPHALDQLRGQFKKRTVEKRYLAIVHGCPARDSFEVRLPLGPVAGRRDLQRVDSGGRPALTRFEVLERLGSFALVACLPHTGRRHQLRVHLSSEGHPLVGDALYRPSEKPALPHPVPHHALHAAELRFHHPRSGERLSFSAPLPPHMEELLRALR